jgi:rhodanese-related sulfurtransferase
MTNETTVPDPVKAWEYFHSKMQFTTGPIELDRMITENAHVNIVDVRYPEDYGKGHIPGAVNVPKDKWLTLQGLDKDKVNVLYCYTQTCHLAAKAAEFFASKGYPVMEMEGGFSSWKAADLKTETTNVATEMRQAA